MASYTNNDNLIKEKNLFSFANTRNNNSSYLFDKIYDEPTYLTFRIDFFPEILKPNKIENLPSYYENDIALMSYNDMPNPLLDLNGDYSTYKYLKNNIGDISRANMLKSFISGLSDIMWNTPYYIQEMEGINDLLLVDPKRGMRVAQDQVLTLKCLDSLDQRILYLMNLYKKTAWDDVYQRWILPDMMRFFNMRIYISEFRVFHENANVPKSSKSTSIEFNKLSNKGKYNTLNTLSELSDKLKGMTGIDSKVLSNAFILTDHTFNDIMPTICLECSMCEFDITDLYSHLNSLSAADPKSYSGQPEIKIKIGNVKEIINYQSINLIGNNLRLVADELLENGKLGNKNNISEIELNTTSLEDPYYIYKNITRADRTGLDIQTGAANPTSKFADPVESKARSFLGDVVKNTVESGVSWVDNKVDTALNNVLNDRLLGGLSVNDVLNGIGSKNIFSMYNTFAVKSRAMQDLYPEVSAATRNGLELEIFKDMLKSHSLSEATTDSEKKLKDLSKSFLEYGEANNFTSTDQYMNVLFDAIKNINK